MRVAALICPDGRQLAGARASREGSLGKGISGPSLVEAGWSDQSALFFDINA